jgi:hypothetical protein
MKGKNRVAMVGVVLAVAGVGLLLTRPWDREPVIVPVVDATGHPLPGVRIRVEVLNASDVSGLAGGATSYLRDLGLDVVYYGKWLRPLPRHSESVTSSASRIRLSS